MKFGIHSHGYYNRDESQTKEIIKCQTFATMQTAEDFESSNYVDLKMISRKETWSAAKCKTVCSFPNANRKLIDRQASNGNGKYIVMINIYLFDACFTQIDIKFTF